MSAPPPPGFQVRYVDPGRGWGMFATRHLHPGELIFADEWKLKSRSYSTPHLESQFGRLSEEDKARVMALSDSKSPEGKSVDGIFRTNCSLVVHLDRYLLFPLFARLNHSCWANCTHSFNAATNRKEVRASRDIPENTELTINYLATLSDWFLEWRERLGLLEELYDFRCDCQLCSLPTPLRQADDESRRRLTRLFLRAENTVLPFEQTWALYQEILATLREHLFPPQVVEYFYRNLFLLACSMQDGPAAAELAMECRKCWELTQGENCYNVRRYSFLSLDPFSPFPELEREYGRAELTEHDCRLLCGIIQRGEARVCANCTDALTKDPYCCTQCNMASYCSPLCRQHHRERHQAYCQAVLGFGK